MLGERLNIPIYSAADEFSVTGELDPPVDFNLRSLDKGPQFIYIGFREQLKFCVISVLCAFKNLCIHAFVFKSISITLYFGQRQSSYLKIHHFW